MAIVIDMTSKTRAPARSLTLTLFAACTILEASCKHDRDAIDPFCITLVACINNFHPKTRGKDRSSGKLHLHSDSSQDVSLLRQDCQTVTFG